MEGKPLVEIKEVAKKFTAKGPDALRSLSFSIPCGSLVGIVGPDGAGKTTLIRLMAGLLKPTQGTVHVDGFDTILQSEEVHAITGYMPQRFALYEDLTVQQNLDLYADLSGVLGEERSHAYERLLHFTGLQPFTRRLASQLSGGMKQKLGLACALLRKPRLLLLDEPSVGVDPASRRELWSMVKELLKQEITIIWSTAYLDEAERCASVLLLHEGEALYYGPPEGMTQRVAGRSFQLLVDESNRRDRLQRLLRDENIEDATLSSQAIRIVVKDRDKALAEYALREVPPRFEDAYLDALGGQTVRSSVLAERIESVQPSKTPVVEAVGLTKQFGNFTAVNQVSFAVKSGEIFGLLGPNGAGKSTTFRMLCGLLKPTAGSACIRGMELQRASGLARAEIGFMAQKFSLYGNLSVRQNLDFFAGIYNLSRAKQRKAIEEMVEIFDLSPMLSASADELPLGYKQRLALACSLMHRPPILFLDEPTSGVDPITRREFWCHIVGLVERGITVVITSHFMEEAEFCDRIALIFQGQLIELGTPEQLKERARTSEIPDPTMEEAFIGLLEQRGAQHVPQ